MRLSAGTGRLLRCHMRKLHSHKQHVTEDVVIGNGHTLLLRLAIIQAEIRRYTAKHLHRLQH